MNDSDIARAASKFVDAKFAIGDRAKGWDCINSLWDFYKDLGIDLPRSFKGWDEANYSERWKKDPDEGRKILGEFLSGLGESVHINYAWRGDLMIFEGKEIPNFPAVYLGNGHILMVFKEGCRVVPLKFFRPLLKAVRRLTS